MCCSFVRCQCHPPDSRSDNVAHLLRDVLTNYGQLVDSGEAKRTCTRVRVRLEHVSERTSLKYARRSATREKDRQDGRLVSPGRIPDIVPLECILLGHDWRCVQIPSPIPRLPPLAASARHVVSGVPGNTQPCRSPYRRPRHRYATEPTSSTSERTRMFQPGPSHQGSGRWEHSSPRE